MAKPRDQPASAAERMLRAAADLLQTGGIEAVSTRAVAAAAGVQPPTIYRQFGDKDGLLDAVAGFVLRGLHREEADADRRLQGSGRSNCATYGICTSSSDSTSPTVTCSPWPVPARAKRAGRRRNHRATDRGHRPARRSGPATHERGSRDRLFPCLAEPDTSSPRSAHRPPKRDPELSSIMFEDMMAAISTTRNASGRPRPSCPAAPWRCEKRCGTRGDLPLYARRARSARRMAQPAGRQRVGGGRAQFARLGQRDRLGGATSCEYISGKVEATEKAADLADIVGDIEAARRRNSLRRKTAERQP